MRVPLLLVAFFVARLALGQDAPAPVAPIAPATFGNVALNVP